MRALWLSAALWLLASGVAVGQELSIGVKPDAKAGDPFAVYAVYDGPAGTPFRIYIDEKPGPDVVPMAAHGLLALTATVPTSGIVMLRVVAVTAQGEASSGPVLLRVIAKTCLFASDGVATAPTPRDLGYVIGAPKGGVLSTARELQLRGWGWEILGTGSVTGAVCRGWPQ